MSTTENTHPKFAVLSITNKEEYIVEVFRDWQSAPISIKSQF